MLPCFKMIDISAILSGLSSHVEKGEQTKKVPFSRMLLSRHKPLLTIRPFYFYFVGFLHKFSCCPLCFSRCPYLLGFAGSYSFTLAFATGSPPGGGGGGYLSESRVGRCGPADQTLTLFKTRISDFPTLFKVSATLQDRRRADHFSAFVFNTNPYKPYIF